MEFLKANLSALWDIVSALQTRAAGERNDESEELVVSLGLKKRETWGPNMKNSFDSQVTSVVTTYKACVEFDVIIVDSGATSRRGQELSSRLGNLLPFPPRGLQHMEASEEYR